MANAANAGFDEEIYSPRVSNSLCAPHLTIFGPELTRHMYPTGGNLGCIISIKTDADRVPTYYYWIVGRVQENGNAVNMLEAGDWITSINGTSTTDRDKTFLENVQGACQRDVLILVIRKPTEHQEFNLWDQNLVTVDIKNTRRMLPFTLAIFHPDINDSNKTIALVDSIEVQKKYLKGRLKRGDKVIAINKHRLEDKTYQELQQIIHQLNPQQQFKLTIERRQWRQDGHLTRFAINSPAYLGWRRLQVELNRNPEVTFGFTFKFVENQLEQPCPIITKIAAGETPAAMSSYLNPGCKITAINGIPVKGLSFNNVKRMLLRAKTSVVLSIQEPTCLLQEENDLPSGERRTWPVQAKTGCLRTSQSEGQIIYSNSFLADKSQLSIDLTVEQKAEGASKNFHDVEASTPLPVNEKLGNPPLPSLSDHDTGGSIGTRRDDIQESACTPSSEPRDTPTDADLPVCQNCLTITIPDKREQAIEHIPGKIYYDICSKLDGKTPFFTDYRILGEELGFDRGEIDRLNNQPTEYLLREWSARNGKSATVGVFMDILDEMKRHDSLQLLQSWTENCPKCCAYQQKNVKESYV